MLIYYIILAFVLLFAFPMCIYKPNILKKRIYVIAVFSVLYIVAASRYGTGNDYFSYLKIFNYYRNSNNFFEAFQFISEPAFSLLNWILSRFTDDIIFINSVYSLLILAPAAYVIMMRSHNVWLSCFLYICLTFYYASMNFTRQSIAASLVLLAFYLFEKKKYTLSAAVMILASCFHLSALIFIPVFALCFIKPEKYLFAAYSVLALVCYFSADILFELGANILAAFVNPRYAEYVGSRFTQSLGWHYILIPLFSFLIVYYAYHTKWRKKEKSSYLFVNLSFFAMIIWLFITKIMVLERFSMYFYIFVIIYIPSAVRYFFGDFTVLVKIIFRNSATFAKDDFNNRKTAAKNNERKDFKLRKNICFSIFGVYMLSCIIYHSYGLIAGGRGFHGVNPYSSGISYLERSSMELGGRGKVNLLFDAAFVYEYFSLLGGNDLIIFISGRPSEAPYLDSVTRAALKDLGIDYKFENFRSDCFAAVFVNGKKLFEKAGNESAEYSTKILEKEIFISSSTEQSQILIDNTEYSLNNSGLNFVVLDGDGKIISKVSVCPDENYVGRLAWFSR